MKKFKIITIISSIIMTALVVITIFALNFTSNDENFGSSFEKVPGYYKSEQAEIISATAAESNYIFMDDLYNNDFSLTAAGIASLTGKKIAIVSAEDLYAFSYLTNPNKNENYYDEFLTYNYELLTNIDYDSYFLTKSSNYFYPIGWDSTEDGFSGSFNGNGFEIKGLRLENITNDTQATTYSNMQHFAMFSHVESGGELTNFGLVETKIAISKYISKMAMSGGVAALCGLNEGTISYCYVKDLREITQVSSGGRTFEKEAGITAMGGYHVSGFTIENSGTINNCYVAYSIVSNYTVTDLIDFQEMLIYNSGTITNLYFYNASITDYQKNGSNIDSPATIAYDQRIGVSYNWPNHFGIYAEDLDALNTLVKNSTTGWIDSSNYGSTIGGYLSIETPIRRGLNLKENTTDTLLINNLSDYLFMYLLFNSNVNMASGKVKYEITADINLTGIPTSLYSYDGHISSTIYGIEIAEDDRTSSLANGSKSPYPTIYNATIDNYQKVEGIDAYGVFPYLTGKVEKLNFAYTSTLNFAPTSSENVKAFGVVSGYVDGGIINNVNTFANITFDDSIGKYFVGGIAGILSGKGSITNVTTSGKNGKTLTATTTGDYDSLPTPTGLISGNAIGGVVGYITDSYGTVKDCYNTYNISSALGNKSNDAYYSIGGIVGVGYTYTAENLENIGLININSSTYTKELYVAGIIGRHLGVQSEVKSFNNQGDITLNRGANAVTTYVCGIENVDIQTENNQTIGNSVPSIHKVSGKNVFHASSLVNRATINLTGTTSQTNLNFTEVLNINSGNGFISTIHGVYNLGYRKIQDVTTPLSDITIDSRYFNSYAPVINNVVVTENSKLNISTVYNLRNIIFNIGAISSATTFNYAGVLLGNFVNYEDVKNEGNLSVNLNGAISTASTLKVSGLFETLSNGCTAKNLFNGGDILVNEPSGSNQNKLINMYLSGICYQNLSVDSSAEQNPLNASFDSNLTGTLDSAINNGDIVVKSDYLKKDVAINTNPPTKPYFQSNVYVGGLTYKNSGIISNAFNLGDINVAVYSQSAKRYEVGGISCLLDGQYAQIRDAANNGDLYVIDLGGKVTSQNSYLNVGGIVAKNTGNNNSTNNNQVIAFSINYGTIIGFFARDNMTTTSYENARSVASGVLGTGFCNLINIVNYGNVYGKECVAGVFGIVKLDLFSDTETTIANTINYGQVKLFAYRNNELEWISYDKITGFASDFILDQNDYNLLNTHAGSICSVFDFGSRNNVKIRYLINLYNEVTVFSSLNNPANPPDISTFITARGATDEFGGNTTKIKYAPLSALQDELGNVGVFSKDFVFRKAIDGIGLDSNYVTDSYIANFFQFVKFDKVNSSLLESIGWRSIAYSKAVEDLVKNVSALSVLVTNAGTTATDLLEDAFDSNTWLSSCDIDVINSLINTALNDSNLSSSIADILDYVLFDTTATSSYTKAIRTSIVDTILEYYSKSGEVDYYEILQTLLYDTLFAKVVSEDDTNYKEVKDKIKEVLEDSTDLESVLSAYINLLETDTTVLNELFNGTTGSYYETQKINLITTLLTGYDEITLESIYNALNLSELDEDTSLIYKLFLQNHQSEATNIYAHLIANNSLTSNANYLAWANNSLSKYNLSTMLDTSSASGTVDGFGNIVDLTGYKYTPITTNAEFISTAAQLKTETNFVTKDITSLNITPTKDYRNLWNIIKNDSAIQSYIQSNYFTTVTNPTTGLSESGIIAKATEYTNSYQTNDRTMSDYGISYSYTHSENGDEFYEYKLDGKTKYYGGINYGYNNTNYSYFDGNGFGKDYAMKTRFIYTPDNYVTYRTNYLGPYATKTGIVYDQRITKTTPNKYFSSNEYGYKKGANLAAVDEVNDTTRGTVPVFISLNENLINNIIASSGTTAGSTLYEYYWNNNSGGTGTDVSSDYMWKQKNFVTYAPENTTGFIYKNYNSGTYMCDYYNFDPEYVPTQTLDYNTYTTLPNNQNVRLVNTTGKDHTNKDYYLTAYCSAAIITGLYYTYSSWPTGGNKCVSLLAKRDGKYAWNKVSNNAGLGYCGVYTTDYICYKMADLVNLDGYKTKGFSQNNPTNDEDETNIIGAIVEKLLTYNKKLVLKAIYNYSVDNDFTAADANTLNMLLTSVSDTAYAYSSVTETIADLVSMNYSGVNTISSYLESLNISLSGYTDKLIVSTATNQNNFRNLLIRILSDYSKKCSDYEDYNTYTRDEINNFIYKYLAYLYSKDPTTTAAQIDALLVGVSDTDLQKLEDLLTHIKHKYVSYEDAEYAYNEFTLYDVVLYSKDHDDYSENVIVAGDYSDVSFYTGDYQYGYKLEVTYEGTIDLGGSDSHTSATMATYTFNSLDYNSFYSLSLSQGTKIYDIKLSEESYSGLSNTPTAAASATSTFATVDGTAQFSNANFVSNGNPTQHTYAYGNYYSNIWRNNNKATDSDMYLKLSQYDNISVNSITITYKALSYYTYNEKNFDFFILYNSDGSKATSSSFNTYENVIDTYDTTITSSNNTTLYQYLYSYTVPSSLVDLLATKDIYLTINLEKEATGQNTDGRQFSINDLIITYDFDFVNNEDDNTIKSNVVFNQNVFNPYYSNTIRSSYTITNSNNNCGVAISGGSSQPQSLTFSDDSPTTVNSTNTKKIDAALLFEPWYYPLVTVPSSLVSRINMSNYDFGGDSIRENFVNGKYNISDVAKYITKDYFTEITNNVSFTVADESFIEVHATGEGNISILDSEDLEIAEIAVSTAQNEYEYYEYVIPNGTYSLSCDNGVSFDLALAVATNIGFDYSTSAGTDTFKVVSGDDEITLVSLDYSKLRDPLNTGASTPSDNNINTVGDDNLSSFNSRPGVTVTYDNYSMFYEVFPYLRNTNTSLTAIQLRTNDTFESIVTLMATIHQDTDNSSYYSIFKDSTFDDDNLKEVIRLLCIADNKNTENQDSAFKELVNGLDSTYYKSLLLDLNNDVVEFNIAKKIYSYGANSSVSKYIYAAYLGDDYLKHNNLYTNSIMYSLLEAFNDGENGVGYYQFITSNTTVDAEKVTALINYLSNNSNINIDGYGIFALSSSQGIGYGIFIPDNLNLSLLDPYYSYDTNKFIESENKSSDWRGGDDMTSSDEGTVNYAFNHDMKQLKLSISTVIFELNLDPNLNNNPITLYSSPSQIDLDNKIITYYVPRSYALEIGEKNNNATIDIVGSPLLANNATYSTNSGAADTINLTNKIYDNVAQKVTIPNAITVRAEDATVEASYTIVFEGMYISFNMEYDNTTSSTINSNGGSLIINVSSPADDNSSHKLPKTLDLSQFIYLKNSANEKLTSDAFVIVPEDDNAIVKSDGSATIKLDILSSLPAGDYELYIDIFGTNASNNTCLTLTKTPSSECDILVFNYEGKQIQFNNNNSYTSYMDYGTAYNYDELLNSTYLEELKYSDNATLNVTVEKNTPSSNGQMTYTVTYLVTAEDGETSKTYKHYLKEKNPFKIYEGDVERNTDFSFTTIYEDGSTIGTYTFTGSSQLVILDKTGAIKATITPTVAQNKVTNASATGFDVVVDVTGLNITIKENDVIVGTLNNIVITDNIIVAADAYWLNINTNPNKMEEVTMVSKDNKNNLYVSFARGNQPSFRIKYVLSNFYTEYDNHGSETITFKVVDDTYKENSINATLDGATAGFFATVSNDMDAGTYKFHYEYSHKGTWENNSEYERKYEFPKLVVTKTYSKEALLKSVTFLESYKVIGNTATAILPGQVMIPDTQNTELPSYNSTDVLYSDVFAENFQRPIVSDDDGTLVYNSNVQDYGDSSNYDDYYIVGTVSGADLQEYAPIFEIEDNAMIFKSTSLYKILKYGAENGQTDTDESILEHHSYSTFSHKEALVDDINFIYVPFYSGTDTLKNQKIYLVSYDSRGCWTGIYSTNTKGGAPLVDLSSYNIDTVSAIAKTDGFTIEGTNYKVSKYAGTTSIVNNSSIYMDFIGSPLENHFHYISYLVLSENYLKNTPSSGSNTGTAKYFHVALIDTSNNVYFDVSIYAPNSGFNYDNVYLTIAENIYDNNKKKYSKSIGAYGNKTTTVVADAEAYTNGMRKYKLVENLQVLPWGYFYFFIDLPEGYKATYVVTNGKTNQINTPSIALNAGENVGSYVAPKSIVTQTIKVAIIIEPASTIDSTVWAVKTSDTFTRQIVQIQATGTISDEHPDY